MRTMLRLLLRATARYFIWRLEGLVGFCAFSSSFFGNYFQPLNFYICRGSHFFVNFLPNFPPVLLVKSSSHGCEDFVKVFLLRQIKRNCSWHFLPEIQRDENLISFQVVFHCGVLCTGGLSVSFWGLHESWWSKKFCLSGFGSFKFACQNVHMHFEEIVWGRQGISVWDPCLKRCPSPRETRCHQSFPLNFLCWRQKSSLLLYGFVLHSVFRFWDEGCCWLWRWLPSA